MIIGSLVLSTSAEVEYIAGSMIETYLVFHAVDYCRVLELGTVGYTRAICVRLRRT